MTAPQVVQAVARCARGEGAFGLRFESGDGLVWHATAAFSLPGAEAQRAADRATDIDGRFQIGRQYSGCPICGNKSFARCGCGKLACWDGETRLFRCPWCGNAGQLAGEMSRLSRGTIRW